MAASLRPRRCRSDVGAFPVPVGTWRVRAADDMPLPQFNKHFDIKLLKLVKENPILYNTSHSNYLNFDAREVVWQKIGDELNRPGKFFLILFCQTIFGYMLVDLKSKFQLLSFTMRHQWQNINTDYIYKLIFNILIIGTDGFINYSLYCHNIYFNVIKM